jgi:hypothetical protein
MPDPLFVGVRLRALAPGRRLGSAFSMVRRSAFLAPAGTVGEALLSVGEELSALLEARPPAQF